MKANYKAWDIKAEDFPATSSLSDQIRFLTGYGLLAPSVHNTQPWLCEVTDDVLTVSPDTDKTLAKSDPDCFGMYFALGAFAENVSIAASKWNIDVKTVFNNKALLMSFEPSKASTSDSVALSSITSRHSVKSPYNLNQPAADVLSQLPRESYGIHTTLLCSDAERKAFSDLHLKASAKVASDTAFVRELTEWLRTNHTSATDGMPGFVTGNSNVQSIIGLKVLKKKPQLFAKAVAKEAVLLEKTPMFAVFTAPSKTAASMINCGRAAEVFWLKAVGLGLSCHPITASVNDAVATKELQTLIKSKDIPCFVLRVGYANTAAKPTPRRWDVCSSR